MCCVPVWWNWQTRGTQNPVMATSCGFDPHHRHQASSPDFFQVPGCFIFVANHTFVFSGKCWLRKLGRMRLPICLGSSAQKYAV